MGRGEGGWTVKRLLEWTTEHFSKMGVDQPRLSAEILLAHVLGWGRIQLYTQFDQCPGAEALAAFRGLVQRAARQAPVAYLTGVAHFFSLEFEVGPAVLIPRPETEALAAEAVDYCRHETIRPRVDVLDLGTGSGCVAVAIAANVAEAEAVAADADGAALEVARRNVERHDLAARVTCVESDLFSGVVQSGKSVFDLIVSNPPYISDAEYERLPATVREYEPARALRGGADGLEFHRRIVAEAGEFLADGGSLMLEVAYDQAAEVVALCRAAGYAKEVRTVRDALGHERVVTARKG